MIMCESVLNCIHLAYFESFYQEPHLLKSSWLKCNPSLPLLLLMCAYRFLWGPFQFFLSVTFLHCSAGVPFSSLTSSPRNYSHFSAPSKKLRCPQGCKLHRRHNFPCITTVLTGYFLIHIDQVFGLNTD